MSRTATTMFGMALVALSIGFNAVRWPIVGRMVASAEQPAPAGESATPEPPANPPAAQPASPASAPSNAVKPLPDVAKSARGDPSSLQPEQSADSASAGDESQSSTSVKQQKPLVPVPRVRPSTEPTSGIEYDGTVRRLPPIDQSEPPPVTGDRPSPNGVIPIYPSTGIE